MLCWKENSRAISITEQYLDYKLAEQDEIDQLNWRETRVVGHCLEYILNFPRSSQTYK